MEPMCCVCEKTTGRLYKEEANPHEAVLCGTECQSIYHGLEQIGAVPANPVAFSNEYKRMPFYLESAKLLKRLKRSDVFAYLCLSHYGQQSAVNPILFKVEGNWYRFKEFMNIIPSFDKMMDPNDPYDIWDKFFKNLIGLAPTFHRPFTDKSGRIVVTTREQLLQYYPEMKPYLELKDKVLFVRLYISAITSAIMSIPKSAALMGWRGYSPVPVPNSLSMNILNYQPGQRVTNWGLGSVSLDHAVSSSFANVQQACCMMFIHIPAGFPVFMLTSDASDKWFPQIPTPYSQMEILLPPGVIFQIGNRMGRRVYKPYTQPGKQYELETIEVYIIGMAQNKGYIRSRKRFEMMKIRK